jgi:murein DD-endopeptidase MepM/ murein hydrolase activator NlpD
MITAILPKRVNDPWGSGEFGASRGSRTHKGIDYACYPGTEITSPVDGVVTKLGYPYGDDLKFRYVEVMSDDGMRHRMFYCEPGVTHGDEIKAGQVVGTSQDISSRYRDESKPPMINHVHYEILDEAGDPINPEDNDGMA